jgi:hypothetical protein
MLLLDSLKPWRSIHSHPIPRSSLADADGSTKESPPTSYRGTTDALINNCLKPVASTLPLVTDEIKKLHAFKYFFKMDAMNAFWSIPLDEESKKLMAFQTHEGVFAWSRLTMGCRPASQVQQTALHTAMEKYIHAT